MKRQGPILIALSPDLSSAASLPIRSSVPQQRLFNSARSLSQRSPHGFKLAHLLDTISVEYDSRTKDDFAQWGHACPQIEQDRLAGGGSLGEDDVRSYEEFACLNCTITAPKGALEGEWKSVPVMVYLHGGAFVEGCGNIASSHDTGRMVALSIEERMPVVIVSMHYCLNWFGFLTSTDLLSEAQAAGDGFVANLGLRDQRLGFQWVQRQIAGFDGDPMNINAFGESGGSISLTHHLCGTEPLFQRVILQSGTVGMPSGGIDEANAMYERLLEYLSIDESTAEARLAALRAAPVEQLVQAVVDLNLAPAWPYASEEDPFYSQGPPRWTTISNQLRKNTWCKEVIVGDSSFEGFMLINKLLRTGGRDDIFTALDTSLQPADAEKLRDYYKISRSLPDNLFWTNVARLLGDFAFSEPTDRLVSALASSVDHKVYRYHGALSNPFPGSMYSFVAGHHFVEVLYLFLTYLERYPTHRENFFAQVAKGMARMWIGFANAQVPWEEYKKDEAGNIAVFDDLRGIDVRTREQDEDVSKKDVWCERRYQGTKIITSALEHAEDAELARDIILNRFLH